MPVGSSIIRAQGNKDNQPGTHSFAYSHHRGQKRLSEGMAQEKLTAFQATPFPVLPDRSFSSFTFSPFVSPNSQHSGLCNGHLSSQMANTVHQMLQTQSGSWQQLLSIKSNLRRLFHSMIQKRQCVDHLFLSDHHPHNLQAIKVFYFSTHK